MTKLPLGIVSVLLFPAIAALAAGDAASVVDLEVFQDKGFVRVEITVSQPVRPVVTAASSPERLVVVLPGTTAQARQKRIRVGLGGVKDVRMGLHSANPPETHVVIDLESMQAHSHALQVEGRKIILAVRAGKDSSARTAAPAGGSVSPLIGILHKRSDLPEAPRNSSPVTFPGTVNAANAPPASTSSSQASNAGQTPAVVPAPAATSGAQASSAPSFGQAQSSTASGASSRAPVPGAGAVSAANTQAPPTPEPATPAMAPATVASNGAGSTIPQPPATSASSLPAISAVNQATVASANAVPPSLSMRVPESDMRLAFKVKYVAQGAAYLDGGRSSGLAEGMKLEVLDDVKGAIPGSAPMDSTAPASPNATEGEGKRVVAQLEVISVAETSAVTDIKTPTIRDVKPGDLAYLSAADQALLVQQRTLSATRKYPQVITFTEGDPLDEEARAEIPRPPSPAVNRARGRIGFDYGGIHSGSGVSSSQVGLVLRADITRIGGTYWNLTGFWRGQMHMQNSNIQPTLQDLINRTYTMSMNYDNPNSAWVAGFGRLYLPWAPSLDTIDGGYIGRKLAPGVTAGVFGGSSPDPTSWSYSPGKRLAGSFLNFQGGSYEDMHYSVTFGGAESSTYGQFDRPLGFFETNLSYKRKFSIYDSSQVDNPPANTAVASPGWGLAQNFFTFRIQPIERLSFDVNHTYFRGIPTFDPQLVGTGLLDKYLFQGLSFGVRAEVIKHLTLYTTLGRSSRTGDTQNSLNEMYGATLDQILHTGIRADFHYSRFNSSFGDGSYEALTLSRNLKGRFHLQLLGGQQAFASNSVSAFSSNTRSRFITSQVDMDVGARYFLSGGITVQRGGFMNYDQWFTTLGYRFDNRNSHHQ